MECKRLLETIVEGIKAQKNIGFFWKDYRKLKNEEKNSKNVIFTIGNVKEKDIIKEVLPCDKKYIEAIYNVKEDPFEFLSMYENEYEYEKILKSGEIICKLFKWHKIEISTHLKMDTFIKIHLLNQIRNDYLAFVSKITKVDTLSEKDKDKKCGDLYNFTIYTNLFPKNIAFTLQRFVDKSEKEPYYCKQKECKSYCVVSGLPLETKEDYDELIDGIKNASTREEIKNILLND